MLTAKPPENENDAYLNHGTIDDMFEPFIWLQNYLEACQKKRLGNWNLVK